MFSQSSEDHSQNYSAFFCICPWISRPHYSSGMFHASISFRYTLTHVGMETLTLGENFSLLLGGILRDILKLGLLSWNFLGRI